MRKAFFSSKNGGRAPPWQVRDVGVVLPQGLAGSIRGEVRRHAAVAGRLAEFGYSIRNKGTIVVWREGSPMGSFTLVQHTPRRGSATIRRLAWDARRGFVEGDVWRAIERLIGAPLGARDLRAD